MYAAHYLSYKQPTQASPLIGAYATLPPLELADLASTNRTNVTPYSPVSLLSLHVCAAHLFSEIQDIPYLLKVGRNCA